MKLGFGLYRTMLDSANLRFARQTGATHIVAHMPGDVSERNAQLLAAQTVMGSAKMLLETDEHVGHLKDMVTSPGGTAIAGLHTLEEGGLRTTLINAVETATKRARELGRGGK